MRYQLTPTEQQLLETELLPREKEACLLGVYCEERLPIYCANEKTALMLGYDDVDAMVAAIGGQVVNIIYPEDVAQVWRDIGEELWEGKIFTSTHRVLRKDGSCFWAICRGRIVRTEDGRLALICRCSDMTTFIWQKEELEQKHFISETIFKNLPGGYHRCLASEGYPLTYVSERFLQILGWTAAELEERFGNSFQELLHPEDRQRVKRYTERMAAPGNEQKYQEEVYRLLGKDGYHWVTDTTMQLEIDGEIFYQGFISDITSFIEERQQQEEKLARLERERQQSEVLIALGRNYHAIFHIDLEADTYREISCRDELRPYYDYTEPSASAVLAALCREIVDEKDTGRMLRFFDLSTLADRLAEREFLEAECITKYGNWHRARLIAKRRNGAGRVTHVLYVTQVIDDEKQYEEHLLAKAEHAEHANRSKTAFISQVAHDIRTPMNSIFGFLEIAEANRDDPEKVRYSLDRIRDAGEFLKALVDDVLDITRMETGRLTLQPEELSLSELLEEVVVAVQYAERGRWQRLRVRTEGIRCDRVLADPLRLKQIYTNVLSNAVKYTQDGGEVDLRVWQEAGQKPGYVRLVAAIADTGVGMSKDFMGKMFVKFERGTDTRINQVSGYGLGLPIVKQLVDLMGGSIDVRSQLGEGTTFTICLEVPCVEDRAAPAKERQVDYAAACAGMHLLVAEDNALNREVITELLEMSGVTCECVEDGALCLERFRAAADSFDAILMDMQMPRMNGVEAAERLRAMPLPQARSIPIVAMTANALQEDVHRCLEAGMDAHLSKPVDMALLLRTLAELCGRG